MLRKNTVFIVGAGASKELGLPVGSELSSLISAMCDIKLDQWGRPENPGARMLLDSMNRQSEGDRSKVDGWRLAMHQIRNALPFKDSIDAVIDQYHSKPEIAEIGKFLIAKLIIDAEAKSKLAPDRDGRSNPDLSRADNTWLRSFSRMLFEGLRKEKLDEIGENVSVICFNYDRCIERYLSHAVAQTYGLGIEEAVEVAARVRIIHAYGSLGALPGWPVPQSAAMSVPFGGDGHNAWQVAQNIQTFSESVDGETDELIKDAVLKGEQYVYLGLSFGRQNMQLLGANLRQSRLNERPAYASGLGQYEQGLSAICRLIRGTYSANGIAPALRGAAPVTHVELSATAKDLLDLHWHNILGD